MNTSPPSSESGSLLNELDGNDRYFDVPVSKESGACSESTCPCGNAVIPKGDGYLQISQKVVSFRKDCPTTRDLQYKLEKMQSAMGCFERFELDRGVVYPRLVCQQAAIRYQLNLEVAAQDAANWWSTGKVPLRATPTSFSR